MSLVYRIKAPIATPPWLEGWEPSRPGVALCHRDSEGGHLVGVCDELVFKPANRWFPVGDTGWEVGRVPGTTFEPGDLARVGVLWCDSVGVADLKGRRWNAPVLLNPAGQRAFRVAYGKSWLPELTEEQDRALAIATEAQREIGAGEASTLEMAVGCQWAAELLCLTHHLHPDVIQALGFLDDRLVPAVLEAAAGVPCGAA